MPNLIGTYNIHNSRNVALDSAFRGVYQANMGMGIFQEKKVTYGIYARGSAGYSVVATDAPSRHRGRVAVFHRPALYFAVEDVQKFRTNVFRFHLAMREWRWYIVGCYLAPDDTSTIDSVIAALKELPRGAELLVAGEFNVNLVEPEGRGYCGGYVDGGT